MSALQSVLIKRVNLKENVWNGTKKLSVITSVRIKRVSVERGFTVFGYLLLSLLLLLLLGGGGEQGWAGMVPW